MMNYIRGQDHSYIGYQTEQSPKGRIEAMRRRTLYPYYYKWCKRQGYEPIRPSKIFMDALLTTLNSRELKVDKERRKKGMYIKGVSLKSSVFDRDYMYGAPYSDFEEE